MTVVIQCSQMTAERDFEGVRGLFLFGGGFFFEGGCFGGF